MALKAAAISVNDVTDIGVLLADARRVDPVNPGRARWFYAIKQPVTTEISVGVAPTAYALQALRAYDFSPMAITEGEAYLRSVQTATGTNAGGFPNGTAYLAWETAVAAEALERTSAAGRADPAVQLALNFLKVKQGTNGAWANDAFSTAIVLKQVGASSTVPLDTDGDGVSDGVERLIGTDINLADAKGLALNGASSLDQFYAYQVLRGKPLSQTVPVGVVLECCTAWSGSLPSGIALSASGSPALARLSGIPTQEGYFDFEFAYKNSAGQSQRAVLNLEVTSRLFRTDADPVALSALFQDPVLSRLSTGAQFLADDFNQDGTVDLIGFLSGANEQFNQPGCDPCTSYAGPNWGLLIGMQRTGSKFALASSLMPEVRLPGDLQSLHVLDYNNDGKTDVLLVLNSVNTTSNDPTDLSPNTFRPLALLRNDSVTGGVLSFTDVTVALGLGVSPQGSVILLDANRDGAPDIVVTNGASPAKLYQFNKTTGVYDDRTSTAGLGPLIRPVAVNFDRNSTNTVDIVTLHETDGLRFLRNNGNGSFSSVLNGTPLTSLIGRHINRIVPADLNGDLWPELVLFESATSGSGSAETFSGSVVRVLNHGGIVNLTPQFTEWPTSVLTTASGSSSESNLGGVVADLDADGLPDVVVASRDVSASEVSNVVFKQNADRSFSRLTTETGFPTDVVGFDSPIAIDLDGDAKLDLVLPNSSNTAYRLTNEGGPNHALTIVLRGKSSARFALGARVTVTAAGVQQEQQLLAGHATSSRLSFGLGHARTATVSVSWPDGSSQTLEVSDVNRVVTITQP
ncbi:MAG: FG-GAP-like repeat-containing protein [Pseudomonadota bacterium]